MASDPADNPCPSCKRTKASHGSYSEIMGPEIVHAADCYFAGKMGFAYETTPDPEIVALEARLAAAEAVVEAARSYCDPDEDAKTDLALALAAYDKARGP